MSRVQERKVNISIESAANPFSFMMALFIHTSKQGVFCCVVFGIFLLPVKAQELVLTVQVRFKSQKINE